uniref:Integrase catalytic domain-containing protein n=1 Tax=Oryza brachyantha TaxID=4533 RepID=J3KUY5_ORYBR
MAWTHLSMDFIEGLPKSAGKDIILVVVDRLTKYGHFIGMSHPITVGDVVDVFMREIHRLHGTPLAIVTDRDRIFTSQLFQEIFNALNVHLRFSTAYHPQTDGQTERVNQCLESYLRSMTFQEPQKWFAWLALAEWWYNTTYHTAISRLHSELCMGIHLLRYKRMKFYADKNRTERQLEVADMVYLKLQPYRQNAFGLRGSLKLRTRSFHFTAVISELYQLPAVVWGKTLLSDGQHQCLSLANHKRFLTKKPLYLSQMDHVVRVYSGGHVSSDEKFDAMKVDVLVFAASSTWVELCDWICSMLGGTGSTEVLRMEGWYDAGVGAREHFVMMPICSEMEWSTYVACVASSQLRALDVVVSTGDGHEPMALACGKSVDVVEEPMALQCHTRHAIGNGVATPGRDGVLLLTVYWRGNHFCHASGSSMAVPVTGKSILFLAVI